MVKGIYVSSPESYRPADNSVEFPETWRKTQVIAARPA